uniref:Src kinase associated phosphoprotein 2 n=1 Tax=Varanus komodoensis TaxID=61221 RepID=A0A8D2L9S4_VARKO
MIYLLLSLSFSPSLSHFHVGNQFPPVAAQDLQFVLKSGYLEKRRKDHSFLGFEWQKRWCALNRSAFYYYGSEKEEEAAPVVPAKIKEPKKQSQEIVSNVSGNKKTDYANFYQGVWDCTGDVPDELTFKRGDVIYILSKEYNRFGWWVGEMKGTIGLVPKAYIMEMYDI